MSQIPPVSSDPQKPESGNSPADFRNRLMIVCALAATVWAAATLLRRHPDATPAPRSSPTTDHPTAVAVPDTNPGYVGSSQCAACHAQRVEDCQGTSHFRTCRPPRAAELPPSFTPAHGNYLARSADVAFEMRREGDTFTQTAIRQTPQGLRRTTSRIDLVLGAGNADDVYLSWRDDGAMFELPVAWIWPSEAWGNSHFCTPYGEGDPARGMTVRCLECHNTWIERYPGTVNYYVKESAILGVTCERCHGPGRGHVEHHTTHPDDRVAREIANPRTFDRERAIEVCTQCHSNAITHRQPPFSYRPGQPLDESFRTHAIAHPENDHVANQIAGLRESKCFQRSEDMTCTTCHDPHQQPRTDSPAASCLKCHQPAHCGEQSRLPADLQGNCVDCHLPRRLKINVKFEIEGDNFVPPIRRSQHRIGVDEIARDEVLWNWRKSQTDADSQAEFHRLTRRLVEHWLKQADELRLQGRFMAAIGAAREALRIEDSAETRLILKNLVEVQALIYDGSAKALHEIATKQLPEAVETLNRMLALQPNDPEFHGKLGTILAMQGKLPDAVRHLDAVAKLDPNSASGFGVLGRIAFQNRKFAEALDLWKQGAEIEPWLPQFQYDMGLALLELKRPTEAIERLRRAVEIDPTRVDVLVALAEAFALDGQWEEALEMGNRAGELSEGGDPERSQRIGEWFETLERRKEEGGRRKAEG